LAGAVAEDRADPVDASTRAYGRAGAARRGRVRAAASGDAARGVERAALAAGEVAPRVALGHAGRPAELVAVTLLDPGPQETVAAARVEARREAGIVVAGVAVVALLDPRTHVTVPAHRVQASVET